MPNQPKNAAYPVRLDPESLAAVDVIRDHYGVTRSEALRIAAKTCADALSEMGEAMRVAGEEMTTLRRKMWARPPVSS